MSRYLYWTILIGDEPTAFRAAEAADLKPTLVQLQRTHPEARMRWFERGRLWSSPAEAHAARLTERDATRGRPSTWRPGGKHVDPRQKYKDAKKAKWTRFKEGVRARADARRDRGDRPARPPAAPPVESRPKRTTDEILADWKPPPPKGHGDRPSPQPSPRTRGEGASRSPQPRDPQARGPQSRGPHDRGPQSRAPQSRSSHDRAPQSRGPGASAPGGQGVKRDGFKGPRGPGAKGGPKAFDRNRARGPRPPRKG